MALGSVVAMLRRLPGKHVAFLEHRLRSPSRSPTATRRSDGSRAGWPTTATRARRDLSLTTIWVTRDPDPEIDGDADCNRPSGPASEARFLLSPAPGMHLLSYRGRLLILYRTRRELQNGGPASFQESLTLQLLGGSRAMIEALLDEAHSARSRRRRA